MHFFTALLAAAAAATTCAAPLRTRGMSPILPPSNPSANGATSYCTKRSECLTIINDVRANQEGLDPITLPSNWNKLTRAERLFTFMNLERTSRGLGALTHLVSTYDSEIKTAIANDADPEFPSSAYGSWESIWAGGSDMIPLAAMYGWMYYDGPGGFNLDCTTSNDSGCWGHRDAILDASVNKISAGAGLDSSGQTGMAAMLFSQDSAPSAAETVLSWATQKTKLA